MTEVVELREEVTRAWAAQAKRMAQEKTILLASACQEANESAQKISPPKRELAIVHHAWDATEVKLLGLAERAATADR
jgi:hypothetical protein